MPDAPNAEQRKYWNRDEARHWVDNQQRYDEMLAPFGARVIAAAALAPANRVLDVGCGCGATTLAAAHGVSEGEAVGIDLSEQMIERARQRALEDGVGNARFEVADAQTFHLAVPFDTVISRFGVMFFDDPAGAFTNIGRAIAPGGRLAFLCWRELARNEWMTAMRDALASGRTLPEPPPNAPGPLSLADTDRVRGMLSDAGFADVRLDPLEEPLQFGPDATSTFDHLQKTGIVIGLLGELDDKARADALERLEKTVVDHETSEGVLFDSSAWLVRAAKAR